MDRIARLFADRFATWSLALPADRLAARAAGLVQGQGWLIQFRFDRDADGEYLDYYASHRMGDDEHRRLYADGRSVCLPSFLTFCQTSKDPEQAQRFEREYRDWNRKVAEDLQAKGFGQFTLDMMLRADGQPAPVRRRSSS